MVQEMTTTTLEERDHTRRDRVQEPSDVNRGTQERVGQHLEENPSRSGKRTDGDHVGLGSNSVDGKNRTLCTARKQAEVGFGIPSSIPGVLV